MEFGEDAVVLTGDVASGVFDTVWFCGIGFGVIFGGNMAILEVNAVVRVASPVLELFWPDDCTAPSILAILGGPWVGCDAGKSGPSADCSLTSLCG